MKGELLMHQANAPFFNTFLTLQSTLLT